MTGRSVTLAASGTVALVGLILSTLVIWLLITQPVTIASNAGPDIVDTARALGAAMWDLVRHLLKYF